MMRKRGLLCLAMLCIVVASVFANPASALEIFAPGAEMPIFTIRKSDFTSLDASSGSRGELESAFVVDGAGKFVCAGVTTLVDLSNNEVEIQCQDAVPSSWHRSGSSVYLTLTSRSGTLLESHLVGYVFAPGQEVELADPHFVFNNRHDHVGLDSITNQKRSVASPRAHEDFLSWVAAWIGPQNGSLSSGEDLKRGISLAKLRLEYLRDLAHQDADAACSLRLPLRFRRALPAAVLAFVEQPVDEEVTLTHMMEDHFKERFHLRHLTANRIDAPPFARLSSGHRATIRTDRPVPVWGFVIDEYTMVISSSAARVAEEGEFFARKTNKRSRPQKIVVVGGKPIAVDASLSVEELGRHIAANDLQAIPESAHPDFRKRGIAADAPSPTAVRPTKTVLYLVANFANEFPQHTEAEARQNMRNSEEYFRTSLFGKIAVLETTFVFVNVTRVPNMDHKSVESQARNLTAPLVWNSFDHWAVLLPNQVSVSWAGLGVINGRGVWLAYDHASTFVHETGHNLGLGHSNFFPRTLSRSLCVTGNEDYGHPADWMGGGWTLPESYSAVHKERLGVLRMENFVVPTESGVYRLYAHDTGIILDGGRPQAMRIPIPRWVHSATNNQYFYVVEMRNASKVGGVSINLHSLQGYTDVFLIDLNQNNPQGRDAAGLLPGSSFVDEAMDLVITNLGIVRDGAPYVDLYVGFRVPTQARLITGTITGPTTLNISANGTVSVTATDPDGGELFYTWFNGMNTIRVSPTTREVVVSWTSAGERTVSVRISNTKGSSTILTWKVRVIGTASQNRNAPGAISGRVVNRVTGAPVVGAVIFMGDRPSARTDYDGFWTIGQPTIGNQTLRAVAEDCVGMTPSWGSDVVTVRAQNGSSGYDWSCTPIPSVSISALVGSLVNGSSGDFRVTRSGTPLTSALNVSITCDCENRAAWVNGNDTFPATWIVTIPANSDSATFPVRHWRTRTNNPRHMLLWCFIRMSDSYKQTPRYRDSIRLTGIANGPANDDFANAALLAGTSVQFNGTFNNASTEVEEPSRFAINQGICPSVWARWSAPGTGLLSVVLNTTYDATVQVHLGTEIRSLMIVSHLFRRDTPLLVPVKQGGVYNFHISSCSLPNPTPGRLVPLYNYTLSIELRDPVFYPPELPPLGQTELSSSSTNGSTGVIIGVIFAIIVALAAAAVILFILHRRGVLKLPFIPTKK